MASLEIGAVLAVELFMLAELWIGAYVIQTPTVFLPHF